MVEIRHRILVNAYPGVGADILHEVRADENELVEDGRLLADAVEVRDHGVRRVESDDRWWSS